MSFISLLSKFVLRSKSIVPAATICILLVIYLSSSYSFPSSSSDSIYQLDENDWISEENDHRAAHDPDAPIIVLPDGISPTKPPRPAKPPRILANAMTYVKDNLPDDFPNPASLLLPSDELFAEFLSQPASIPPKETIFPEEKLSEIREADAGPLVPAGGRWDPPKGSFAQRWKEPKLGEKQDMPKIQAVFGEEAAEDRKLREGRRDVVRGAFVHAWAAYKANAWGNDEIRPVSGVPSNPFMGWGASIIDALDTLLLLQLPEEFLHARKHVRELDFGIISGIDWGRGTGVSGDKVVSIHAFETVIRYLGGLLSAYDLSGDELLKQRAEELGKILMPVWDSSSGVPLSRLNPKNPQPIYTGHAIQLAEAGTLLLEYTRLSQLTGNKTYFNVAQRAMDYLDKELSPKSAYAPLLPAVFSTESYTGGMTGTFSFGGMADSYYEYIIKQHLLLRGAIPQYSFLHGKIMTKATQLLFRAVEVIPGKIMTTAGEFKQGRYQAAQEHLSCFVPSILGLGAKLLPGREKDLETAKLISQTCYYLGAAQKTGIQPERADFYLASDAKSKETVIDEESGEQVVIPKGKPLGVKAMHKHYVNRPESLESVFYLYRLTGDKRYQDQGWRMFTSWVKHAKTEFGFSSLADVTNDYSSMTDNQESFTFAETFKYYYLLFAEPTEMSLDDYVLNTEAHPFIHNPSLTPGSSGLHSHAHLIPPSEHAAPIGEGTSVQKNAVLWEKEALRKLMAVHR